MKALLIILALGALNVSCSSNTKNVVTDQAVKAVEAVKTPTVAAPAVTAPSAENLMITECKLGKDTRMIAVDKNGANGCIVNYTKNDESKQVGQSANGKTFCEEIAKRIATNLTNSGFTCQ